MLNVDQANRSVSLLGYDNQVATATWQAAWLRNTPLVKQPCQAKQPWVLTAIDRLLFCCQDCSSSSVLQIMNLLVSVAYRECMTAMDSAAKQSDKLPHLVHLLCSLQTSLLASCSHQLETAHGRDQAESLIIQCLCLYIPNAALTSALKSH